MLPDLSIFWVVFFVLVLTGVLNQLLFKPLQRVMAEREHTMRSARELAERSAAEARAATSEFEAKTSAARAENPDASPDMIDRLKQIDKLKADLAGLQTRVTSKHPDVLRMQEQIAALEKEQAAAEALVDQKQQAAKAAAAASQAATEDARAPRRRTIESIDAELKKLRDEETTLRATIASFEQRLQGAPEREQEYSLVTRDRQVAKDLYD